MWNCEILSNNSRLLWSLLNFSRNISATLFFTEKVFCFHLCDNGENYGVLGGFLSQETSQTTQLWAQIKKSGRHKKTEVNPAPPLAPTKFHFNFFKEVHISRSTSIKLHFPSTPLTHHYSLIFPSRRYFNLTCFSKGARGATSSFGFMLILGFPEVQGKLKFGEVCWELFTELGWLIIIREWLINQL